MRKNVPNEPNIDNILNLLCSLDGGLLKAIQARGTPIIVVTAVPVPWLRDDDEVEDGCDDADDYDDELEDEEGCCPEYEPSGDGTNRCVYSCPECGTCLRSYIGEEFE